jgi:hypothetical protein
LSRRCPRVLAQGQQQAFVDRIHGISPFCYCE